MEQKNVLGTSLTSCCLNPITGENQTALFLLDTDHRSAAFERVTTCRGIVCKDFLVLMFKN
jgi:hypothetical protein